MKITNLYANKDEAKIDEIFEDLKKRYPHDKDAHDGRKYVSVGKLIDETRPGIKTYIMDMIDSDFWTQTQKKEIAEIASGIHHAAYEIYIIYPNDRVVDIIIARYATETKGTITYIDLN